MAGKPGRSGGARAGAGRKKKVENDGTEYGDSTEGMAPLEVLKYFMNHDAVPIALRLKAAQAAAPFEHQKLGEGGKKEGKQEAAKRAGKGKFGATAPPRLVSSRG